MKKGKHWKGGVLKAHLRISPTYDHGNPQQAFAGLQDVLKASWRHILKTPSRRLGDKKMGISYFTNLNGCVSNKQRDSQILISQIYIWRIQGESKIIN